MPQPMRREVRVPGISEPGCFFVLYSCGCGHVECLPDNADAHAVKVRGPATSWTSNVCFVPLAHIADAHAVRQMQWSPKVWTCRTGALILGSKRR